MKKPKHRIRISGRIIQDHEQIIELSDEDLKEFRQRLNAAIRKGDKAIDDYLGEEFGDTDPINWEHDEWSAELINDNGSVIEHLDFKI